jgi:hypothetical protein
VIALLIGIPLYMKLFCVFHGGRMEVETEGSFKMVVFLDFRLSSCFECRMFSFGLFSSIANILEHCSIFIGYEDGTDRVFQNIGY